MRTERRKRSAARVIAALALVIGLAACSTAKGSDAVDAAPDASAATTVGLPVVAEVPQVLASIDLKLPLDDYLSSVNDLERYGLARRVLIGRCLSRFGVDAAIPQPVTGIGPRTWTERRYGLSNADEAAVLGYGLGSRDPRAHRDEADDPRFSSTALAVLTGEGTAPPGREVPPGGCSAEAQRILAGRVPDGEQVPDAFLAQQLSQESFERSRRDPRVLDAFDLWSSCMRRQGHQYANPLAPFSDPRLQHGASSQAIDTAVDDVECKRRTNLIGTWYAVESAYQKVLIDDHRPDLDTLAAANAVTSGIVTRVLSES